MFDYLFTNDLRITSLNAALKTAADNFINDTVPTEKSANNNTLTLGFYFNITKGTNCAKAASDGQVRLVVLNFIKKFQFPNMRKQASFDACIADGIRLAPMRLILQLLYIAYMNDKNTSYLTRDEIKNFIFYNNAVAKSDNVNITELYNSIKLYRKNGTLPTSIETNEQEKVWNQEDRQLREMLKILEWAGCVKVDEKNQSYALKVDGLSIREKAELFDIISYDKFWTGNTLEDYKKYMDISDEEISEREEVKDLTADDKTPFQRAFEESSINQDELSELYETFHNKFGPEALSKLEGENLLNTIFYAKERTNDSLCYWLEFHPKCREFFGGIAGGSSFKFGLFYSLEQNSWITGSSNSPSKITTEQAIEVGTRIRDTLLKGTAIIAEHKNFATPDDYYNLGEKLQNELGKFSTYVWVQKYFHMIFPDVFSTFYSCDIQRHILFSLGILPIDSFYARHGQLVAESKKHGIPNAIFANITGKMFGPEKHFYRIGTGDTSKNYFSDWVKDETAAIGWSEVGDLSAYKNNKSALIERLSELYYPDSKQTASRKANEMLSFLDVTTENSIFVAMDGKKILGMANVQGGYYYDSSKEFAHCRKVRWDHTYITPQYLPIQEGKSYMTTFVELDDDENILFLYNLLNSQNETLQKDENMTDSKINCLKIERNPRTNKLHPLNFIIYGAPGTGKTYSTAEYALAIIKNEKYEYKKHSSEERKNIMSEYNELVKSGRIIFTTFHQNYGYEDFIQGLRPDTQSKEMNFKTVDGVFKKIADKALADEHNNYVIVIDEINRANISKVFGELITLIEEDKRWGEINQASATLPSGDIFAVPNNLYIIGTMNSADKSISLIDTALRRRFEFIEQKPDASLVSDPLLRAILEKLNSKLVTELDSTDLLIGHSYFMNRTKADLARILNNAIIPLLYEYFYDNRKKVYSILSDVIKDTSVVINDSDSVGRISVMDKES